MSNKNKNQLAVIDNYGLLLAVICLGVLTYLSAYFLMFVSGYLISKASTRPYNILMIYIPILLTRTFGIARPVFRYLQRLTSHNWVLKATSRIRLYLYNAIEASGIFYKQKYKSGKLLSMLIEDISTVQNMYLRSFFTSFVALVIYTILAVGYGVINIYYAIIISILLGFILFIIPYIAYRILHLDILLRKEKTELMYQGIVDNILGVIDIILSNKSENAMSDISKSNNRLLKLDNNIFKKKEKIDYGLNFVFLLALITTILFIRYAFPWTDKNYISAIALAFFVLADVFLPITESYLDLPIYKKSMENLRGLNIEVEKEKEVLSTEQRNNAINNEIALTTNNLSIAYENSVIIKDLNLTVKKGERLCILGGSGQGKSTLLKGISGMLDEYTGEISVFGYSPKKVDMPKSRFIASLNQSPWIFNTSIYHNLTMANPQLTYSEANEIIKKVGLTKKIDSLEKGLDTVIIEGGKSFSGGEKQRLALARILCLDTPIILLDEPTVGLDSITEKKVLDTIFDSFQDKTILWVTHHFQDIERVDRVIYLKDSKIIMDDKPKILYENNELFRKLYLLDKGLN